MGFRTLHELGHDEKAIQLVDIKDNALGLHAGKTDIILVPQPSDNVNDPLRWPTWKKYCAFLNICVFTAMVTGFISGFSPALYLLGLEFKTDLQKTSALVTWPLLTAGLGNFIWVPLAEYFGKRPVFVTASLIFFAAVVGSAISTNYSSLLASRVLSTIGGSSTEALGAAIINDIFHLHERGSKMGIYIVFLYGGNSLMSLISGFIIDGAGWRWFCWLCAIIACINFLAIFFLVPETRFDREAHLTTEAKQQSLSDLDVTSEKVETTIIEHAERRVEAGHTGHVKGLKKTFWQNLSLWSGTSKESIFSHFMRPWLLGLYPAVFWCTVTYSLVLAWQIAANTLSSFIFQLPPYNFSPGVNSLINIPALLGNLIGSLVGGKLTDVYVKWHAKRHNGIFSPESRLVLLIIPALFVPAGLLMFGFGAERHLHWAVLFVGYFFLNFCNAAASIGMSYVIDSYYEVTAEALLLINGAKNAFGFGFTYGFVPWTVSAGYETVFGTMAATFFTWLALAIPLYIFGAGLRTWTSRKLRIIFW